MASDGNELIIAFRGTINLENWFSNFSVKQVECPAEWHFPADARVHKGFKDAVESVLCKEHGGLGDILREEKSRNDKLQVIVTGHCLGGGLAAVFSVYAKGMLPSTHPFFLPSAHPFQNKTHSSFHQHILQTCELSRGLLHPWGIWLSARSTRNY